MERPGLRPDPIAAELGHMAAALRNKGRVKAAALLRQGRLLLPQQ